MPSVGHESNVDICDISHRSKVLEVIMSALEVKLLTPV